MENLNQWTGSKKTWHYLLLIILSLLILGPFIIGLWTSLLPTADISSGKLFIDNVSLDNYWAALTQTPIIRYLFNSLFISILTMICQVFFCSLAAYAFVFIDFKYRNFYFYLVLSTMMLPFEAEVIPNFQTIKSLGLLNSYLGMVIPFMTSAFGIFMLRQSFMQMPYELKEAADVEGLSHWQFYLKGALPYSKLSIYTLAAYSFLSAWNQYLWPLLTTFSDDYRPVQVGLRELQSQETFNNWGMIQASAAIIVIPTLIVLYFGQHYFKSGLNEGAVK
ncbi:carbohydrate ABC transporter permease [Oenococcus oeni]|uniref:carbohydrate ABC transporter permease n=1 Tax=Oenococcus oeni TaxID=1247 RepID=UPI00050F1CE3|nr:carbohydrate ABC transporter permease [Oenococcus oeni]KGI02512.1 glycerol-3-phosphate ABC transporter permease [Oenococcus oeni IOEB_C52]SYW11404.1 putative sn-glycerol-3-phosphate transport system permease protein (UgpE) [Oenococcus oeni]SYW19810.1 putative sn-glycerol-3-phosphate transport system permease protein (UgpE) [Oenococcus oeni]